MPSGYGKFSFVWGKASHTIRLHPVPERDISIRIRADIKPVNREETGRAFPAAPRLHLSRGD